MKNKTKPTTLNKTSAKKSILKQKRASKTVVKATKKASEKKVAVNHKIKTPTNKNTAQKPSSTQKTSIALPKEKLAQKQDAKANALIENVRIRNRNTGFARMRNRKNTPIVFTLEDVKEVLEKQATQTKTPSTLPINEKVAQAKALSTPTEEAIAPKNRTLQAASIMDILGFNPNDRKGKDLAKLDEERVPKKFLKHYRSLISLRKHFKEELDLHTQETLKHSSKDDSGDLSGYSQHMADAGTDNFDRDFALSILCTEQDALYEIEEAIQRIFDDQYGVCEINGTPIDKERLLAVPFTRYSLQGQQMLEKTQRRKVERGGVFTDISGDDSNTFADEDTE